MPTNTRNSAFPRALELNVWGSLGLNFDYDWGPIIENGGSHLFIYGPSVKGFKQALVVKQVSQNIKSFSYLNDNGQPFVST